MHAVVFGHGTNEILFRLLHLVVDGQRPVAGTKKNSVKFPDFSFFFPKLPKIISTGFQQMQIHLMHMLCHWNNMGRILVRISFASQHATDGNITNDGMGDEFWAITSSSVQWNKRIDTPN